MITIPRTVTAFTAALVVWAAGCDDTPPRVLLVDLVSPDGGDPTVETDVDTLVVHVRHGDGEVRELTAPIDDPDIDVRVEDVDAPIALTAELVGDTDRRLGAPPTFIPSADGGSLRLPMGAPGECAELTGESMRLRQAHGSAGVGRSGTFALVAGGETSAGPSSGAEAFDLLRMGRAAEIEDLPDPAGPTAAATMGDGRVLLVPDAADPVIYDLSDPEQRVHPVSLHAGADASSAVVSLPEGGAVVLGGGGASPVDGVTWVDPDGRTHEARLAEPRAHAAAALLGDQVLLAGGMADGAPLAEVLGPTDGTGRMVADEPDHGVRDGAVLAVRDGRAWLLGGTDASGVPRTDTALFSGCPDVCVVEAGSPWPDARAGVAPVPTGAGVLLVGGDPPNSLVEHARLDATPPQIQPRFQLAIPRAEAGAVLLEAGLLVVLGGRGPGGVLDSVELCWPSELAAP
ncbi:MAG: hypothetical protein ACOCV4_07095 [Myxococcota bacterium]